MNKIFSIIFVFLFCSLYSFGLDDTIIISKTDSLKFENLKLLHKIELVDAQINALESSTDRILNALYFTIGIILTVVLGLNIWNWFRLSNKHKAEIQKLSERLKKEVSQLIDEKIKNIPFNEIDKSIREIRELKNTLLYYELIDLEKNATGIIDTNHLQLDESDIMERLLYKAIEYWEKTGDEYHLTNTLEGWINFLKRGSAHFHHSTRNKIINQLSNEKFSKYSDSQIIIDLLKK